MTLLVRDEADIIDAQIAFHLNAGVDFVIATDNASRDGTREILASYARDGCLHLIDAPGSDYHEQAWTSSMARLAKTRFGADWVINSAADEFWWPRWATLPEVLDAVPGRYGMVPAFIRHFLPRLPDERHFAERMTVRLAPQAPINDPVSPFRAFPKVVHRAHAQAALGRGAHALIRPPFECLHTWHPIEVLHFPIRSPEQSRHKAMLQWDAFATSRKTHGTGKRAEAYRANAAGLSREYYESLAVEGEVIARGVADGSLVIDTRLRDILSELRDSRTADLPAADAPAARIGRFPAPSASARRIPLPQPGPADDVGVAVDVAILNEAQSVRCLKKLDALEKRLLSGSRKVSAHG